MRRLNLVSDSAAVAGGTTVTTLPMPPLVAAPVPDSWNASVGALPQFDLELLAAAALTATNLELFGGKLVDAVFADDVVESVSAGSDTVTFTGHAFQTGDGPFVFSASFANLVAGTSYWTIYDTANTVKFATSLANALAGTAVDLAASGSTPTLADIPGTTKMVVWMSFGLLESSLTMTARRGGSWRIDHRSNIVAYALAGTLSTSNVSWRLLPIIDQA